MSTKIRQLVTAALSAAVAVGLMGAVPAQGAADPAIGYIAGRVTLNGEPQRAEIRLVTVLDDGTVSYNPPEKTDKDGYFRLSDAAETSEDREGEWYLIAEGVKAAHTTYYPGTAREPDATPIRFVPGETVTANIELVPAALVTGRVLDTEGQPVEGARVVARFDVTSIGPVWYYASDRTDAEGRYVMGGLPAGSIEVRVSEAWKRVWDEPGTTVTTVRGETSTVPDLTVTPYAKDGKITAKITGLTKNDVIWLFDTKTRHAVSPDHATSFTQKRKNGTATIKASLRPGKYRLVIGGTNVASKVFTVKPKKTTKVPTFASLKSRTTLTGKLKKANGKKLANASVSVFDSYGTPARGKVTSKKGTYKVKGLGKGFYSVLVDSGLGWGPERAVKEVVITKKKAKKNLRLARTATLSGQVTHGSTPVQGIEVLVLQNTLTGCVEWAEYDLVKKRRARDCFEDYVLSARTDAQGRYTIPNVPVGKGTFVVYENFTGGYQTVVEDLKIPKKGKVWDVALTY